MRSRQENGRLLLLSPFEPLGIGVPLLRLSKACRTDVVVILHHSLEENFQKMLSNVQQYSESHGMEQAHATHQQYIGCCLFTDVPFLLQEESNES